MSDPLYTLYGRSPAANRTVEYVLLPHAALLERLEENLTNFAAEAVMEKLRAGRTVGFTANGVRYTARRSTPGDTAYFSRLREWIAAGSLMPLAVLTRRTWGGEVLEKAVLDRRALHLALAPERSLDSIIGLARRLGAGSPVTLLSGETILALRPFDPYTDELPADPVEDDEDEDEDGGGAFGRLVHALKELLDCYDDDTDSYPGDPDDRRPKRPGHIRPL